jgi:uncharacterized linocin/CFP29 family protein
MFVDFVLNGQGHGEVGAALGEVRFDPGLLRPFIARDGQPAVTVNTGRMRWDEKLRRDVPVTATYKAADLAARGIAVPTANATSLRKNDWINIDTAVQRATRQRLRAWADLAASSSVGGFNGMAKLTHEYESMTDPGEAVVDMDGLADGRNDSPLFKLRSVPLPITHSDFWFSERRLAVSRNSGTPLDTTMAEAAGRRVAEMIERTLLGVETGVTYGTQTAGVGTHDGTSTVYGYTNFPYRVTKTDLTTPTGSNPEAVKQDVIEMRETMYTNGFYGPFMLYHSTGYDAFLDDDYFRSGSTAASRTLRERVGEIEGIAGIRRLDYLTSGYQMVLVQMTSDVAQAINAMDVTTVQWDSQGGLRKNFKVMAIQVPLLKAPYNGVAGIVHGTTS